MDNEASKRKRAKIIASIITLLLFPIVAIGWMILMFGLSIGYSSCLSVGESGCGGGTSSGYLSGNEKSTIIPALAGIAGTGLAIFFLVYCWVHFYRRTLKKSLKTIHKI